MSAQPEPLGHTGNAALDLMWTEYADATTAHLNLQLDVYMAVASDDNEREETLNQLLILAEERRRTAREVIRRCERSDLPA
jgi:hypothetical protein